MTPVSHYGILRQDGLTFLHETGGGRCLNPRLSALESPFKVSAAWQRLCPHRLGTPEPGPVLDHPFVKAMGPDQNAGLYHLRPQDAAWAFRLAQITPADESLVVPFLGLRYPRIRWVSTQLMLTNAAPFVLLDISTRYFAEAELLASLPRIRNLILSTHRPMHGSVLLDPKGLPTDHDWAAEGRRHLYQLVKRGT